MLRLDWEVQIGTREKGWSDFWNPFNPIHLRRKIRCHQGHHWIVHLDHWSAWPQALKRGRMEPGQGGTPIFPKSSRDSSQSSARAESRSSSIDSDAAIMKKKKVEEYDLPWVNHNKLLRVELWPELHATLDLLQAWLVSPKQVKASIFNMLRCPTFPDSKWLNLIQGKYIDLGNVFSGFYSTLTDDQQMESIREVKFKFGTKDVSKPVTTHGDWTIAFDLTQDTCLFIFTHKAKECKWYQHYILQQFTTKRESKHPRVITLDWASHKRVSECWNWLLSNFDQFNDLQTMHLNHCCEYTNIFPFFLIYLSLYYFSDIFSPAIIYIILFRNYR